MNLARETVKAANKGIGAASRRRMVAVEKHTHFDFILTHGAHYEKRTCLTRSRMTKAIDWAQECYPSDIFSITVHDHFTQQILFDGNTCDLAGKRL